jgi:hypothetical protein
MNLGTFTIPDSQTTTPQDDIWGSEVFNPSGQLILSEILWHLSLPTNLLEGRVQGIQGVSTWSKALGGFFHTSAKGMKVSVEIDLPKGIGGRRTLLEGTAIDEFLKQTATETVGKQLPEETLEQLKVISSDFLSKITNALALLKG